MKRLSTESGFTIVELLLAVSIAMVISTVLMTVSLSYYGNVIQNNQAAELAIKNHYALRAIIEDIRLADSIEPTGVLSDANSPTDGWTTDDAANTLIIGSPATTTAYDVIYDESTGYPYRNELVYFVSGTNLYKRTIKNTAAIGNRATTSCPVNAASSGCPADKTYSSHTDDISFRFFDETNALTTDPSLARSVEVTLTSSRRAFGKTISYTNTIQTTLRNR